MPDDTARDWLPATAFTDEAIGAAFAPILARWSGHWFAAGVVTIARDEGEVDAGEHSRIDGAFLGISLRGAGKKALLEAALSVDLLKQAPLRPADHRLLGDFCTRVLRDLVSRIEAALPAKGVANDNTVTLRVFLDAAPLAVIEMPISLLASHLRANVSRTRTYEKTPRSLIAALRPTRLDVEGVLGHADLALEDVRGLSAGDVIVLDRGLNEAVELHIRNGRQIGKGRLGRMSGRVSIHF